ncbi:MAG: CRTAC1 family protein, partial [Acidobacteriota bacterium]
MRPALALALLLAPALVQPKLAPSVSLPAATVSTSPAPQQAGTRSPAFRFVDTAAAAGLDQPVWCGRPEKPHLLESGGSGLALLDYDDDDDLDVYVVNGWRLAGSEVVERGRDRLYRNRGDGTFEDVTDEAGLGQDGWGTGVAVGDFDGDGRPDLFVSNFGPDVLYRNRGDGTFEQVADGPGGDGWSTGAVFFDADGDGDEDLFVAAYVATTLAEVLGARPELRWQGIDVMRGPFGLEGDGNRYFVNDGAGGFHEATAEAGMTDVGLYYSFAVAALDLDGDLDVDLYVANDSNPNYLYDNDGAGHFEEVGLWSGAAVDGAGQAQAGMGLGTGDVDGDGAPDLLVTHFAQDKSTLYRNLGAMVFEDITEEAGLAGPTFGPLSWGAVLADFDLDADLDLFIANGHIYPQADESGGAFAYKQMNQLFEYTGAGEDDAVGENEGGGVGRFHDVSGDSGAGLAVVESSRGVAAGDIDNDGDVDLVISNVDAPPTLLRNDSPRRGAWLLVDAPGALRVIAEAGGRTIVRDRVAGGSYVSASDPRFHFGLGPVDSVERLRVLWPDGSERVLEAVEVNRIVR